MEWLGASHKLRPAMFCIKPFHRAALANVGVCVYIHVHMHVYVYTHRHLHPHPDPHLHLHHKCVYIHLMYVM